MKKKHIQLLQDINRRVPQEWKDVLMHKVKVSETIKEVFLKALTEPGFPEEKRKKIQNILDAGFLDEEVMEVDKIIEDKIDEFIKKEVDKEVELGNLPKKIKVKAVKKTKKQ